MRVAVRGYLEGRPVEAEVEDGKLSGDPVLVSSIKAMVAGSARVGLGGLTSGAATIDGSPELVRATLATACDAQPRPVLSGDNAEPSGDPEAQQ